MSTDSRPERPWATGVLVVSGLISLSFNVQHSLHATHGLPGPLAFLYGAGPVALAAAQSHVVAIQAARGELVGGKQKAITFGLVIGALALSFLGMYDLLQHAVPNPFPKAKVNLPAVLTPIVVDLMAIAALNELLRTPGGARTERATTAPGGPLPMVATEGATTMGPNAAGATTPIGPIVAPRPRATSEGATEPKVAPRSGPENADTLAPANKTAESGSNLVEFTSRGESKVAMRRCWDARIAEGVIPSGGDLNRAVDKPAKYSLGKKYAKEWGEELPDAFVEAVEDGRVDEARSIAATFVSDSREEAAG